MNVQQRCPRCGETKDRAQHFARDRSRSTGYRAFCKSCVIAKQRAQRAARRHPIDAEQEKTTIALMVLRLVEQVGIEMRCEPTLYAVKDDCEVCV